MRLFCALLPSITMALPIVKRLMIRSFTVQLAVAMVRQLLLGMLISSPSNSTSGVPVKPDFVVPSIMTELVMVGSEESSWIVCKPVATLAKLIVFWSGVEFESRIAWRSEPAPLSLVLLTEKVEGTQRSSRISSDGRERGVLRQRERLRLSVKTIVQLRG